MTDQIIKQLRQHARDMNDIHMSDLFSDNPDRGDSYALHIDNQFYFNYAKNRINDDTLSLLTTWLEECDFDRKRQHLFNGDTINITEGRAAHHTTLRDPNTPRAEVLDTLSHIKTFTQSVHNGTYTGHTNKKITDIIHIGIGGSALGPQSVMRALTHLHRPDIRIHFLSNIDGAQTVEILKQISPETTLVIVASKTFTTQETMTNANTLRQWFLDKTNNNDQAIKKHFIALTANTEQAQTFGIEPDLTFPLWDWVGGRFSLWSSIGLPIALGLGFEQFQNLLNGAHKMDTHFKTAPIGENIPALMAMIGAWYRTCFDMRTACVIPYHAHMDLMPSWLQQLDMESNGKPAPHATGPVIFGTPGTEAQHSYMQLIHQGSDPIPVDFIGVITPEHDLATHHDILLSHMLAQSSALMNGQKNKDEPHKNFNGNRPSNTFLLHRLTPQTLGMLLCAYEHKIFTQGILWGINSFDQFGVELGKTLSQPILKALQTSSLNDTTDPATQSLIAQIKSIKDKRSDSH